MKSILITIVMVFLLFNNIFTNEILKNIPLINYWDELAFVLLVILYMFKIAKQYSENGKMKIMKYHFNILLSIFLVIIIGLAGNFIWGYAYSTNAIVRDILAFVKFPVTYVLFRELTLDKRFAKEFGKYCIPFIKVVTIMMLVCGIISLFVDIGMSQDEIRHGLKPFQFLFSHPTYLVQNNIFIMSLLLLDEKNKNQIGSNTLYIIMLSIIIIISFRTKGIVVVAGFIYLRYGSRWLKKVKVLYWMIAIGVVVYAAMDKLQEYISFSNSPREALYMGAIELLKRCFPIGSGFATYGSHISGEFYSKVYDFISIPVDWGNGIISALGDAGYVYYIGQFGILGTIILIISAFNIYKSFQIKLTQNWALLLLVLNIAITLTTEALLCNNGLEYGIILAIVVSEIPISCKEKAYEKSRNSFII